jgi:Rhodopirellula transposase DDE domain
MPEAAAVKRIRKKYRALSSVMDERMRRQWAAAEAQAIGWGGVSLVSTATGLARNTIVVGGRELEYRCTHPRAKISPRLRAPGGGRKRLTELDPGLRQALDDLVDPMTRGHPESPLRWTCKSTSKLAEELQRQHHRVTDRTVASLLKDAGFSLQANRKMREGLSHPDRNAQFEYMGLQQNSWVKTKVDFGVCGSTGGGFSEGWQGK